MRAQATVSEGRILLRTQASNAEFEAALRLCKEVPGARWHKPIRSWSYPLAIDTCHALRRVWGEALIISQPLVEWYRLARAVADAQALRSTQGDAALPVLGQVAPRLALTLRGDQRAGAAWVAAGYRGAGLVADDPGCGKTLVTIAGILEANLSGPMLIVCPRLSVKAVWHREWRRWTDERVYMARGNRAKRQRAIDRFWEDPADRKVLIVVAEMLRIKEKPDPNDTTGKRKVFDGYEYPSLFQQPWSVVCVDESHRTFGSLTVVKGNLAGKGLKRLPQAEEGRRYAITGTPFGKGGRVQGMFGTLHWLWPDEYTSFWRWVGTYFEVTDEVINRSGQTAKKIGGLKNGVSEEEFLRSLGPRILRRTKAEVLPWLPAKQYIEVVCEMEAAQTKQYRSLMVDAEVVAPGGVLAANGVLAEITRAKQLANGVVDIDNGVVRFTDESCKIDMLWQGLEDRGILDDDGHVKVIVASQFNEFLYAVQRRLDKAGVSYLQMTGSTSDKKRDDLMETFQSEGGPRIFLINSKVGGVSVTLDAADELHALDELWDPGDNTQLEDRIHRASRVHQVTVFYYRTEGTIDSAIAEDVEGKRFIQFNVLDGRRGLAYLRDMIKYRKPEGDE